MRSNFLSTILIAITVAQGVLSIPLELSHGEAKTDDEKTNLANLNAAKDEANRQIPLMEKVLADPTNAKHKPLIDAAFGTHSSLDLNKVKDNVHKLKTGTVPVHLPTAPGGSTIAYNRYDADHPPMNPVHVEFGKKYHKSALSTQAGTLIHEATHYLGNTGDYIENNKMLKGNQHETEHMGYTSKTSFYKTPKSLNGDKTWTTMRDSTHNMHDNAEAYGQFASMCANADLARRDVENFRRALIDGDSDSVGYYLSKRAACKLPKDYFKKKAAAAKKTGAAGNKVNANAKTKKAVAVKGVNAKSPKTKGVKSAAGVTKPRVSSAKFGKQSKLPASGTKTKSNALKKLPGGRTAKAVGKVAGSRRPLNAKATKGLKPPVKGGHSLKAKAKAGVSRVAGKRVAKTGVNKGALKHSSVKAKHPLTKGSAIGGKKKAGSSPRHPVTAGKRVSKASAKGTVAAKKLTTKRPNVIHSKGKTVKKLTKPAAKVGGVKGAVTRKHTAVNKKSARPAVNNRKVTKPSAKHPRPASGTNKKPTTQSRKTVASKKGAHQATQKKTVQHKVASKPAPKAKVAAPKHALKSKAAPKPAPKSKVAPKNVPKSVSKKGRRDLEDMEELEF